MLDLAKSSTRNITTSSNITNLNISVECPLCICITGPILAVLNVWRTLQLTGGPKKKTKYLIRDGP